MTLINAKLKDTSYGITSYILQNWIWKEFIILNAITVNPKGNKSDWSLIMKCSQFLSISIRRRKGTNQEHFSMGGQLKNWFFPLQLANFTLRHCEQQMVSKFLPGSFLMSPICTFDKSQLKDRPLQPFLCVAGRVEKVKTGKSIRASWSQELSMTPIRLPTHPAKSCWPRDLTELICLSSLPLCYCWHLIYSR